MKMRNISVFGYNYYICKWDAKSRVTSPSGLSQPIYMISLNKLSLFLIYSKNYMN